MLRDDPELAATCRKQPPLELKGFRDPVPAYEVPWHSRDVSIFDAGQTQTIIRDKNQSRGFRLVAVPALLCVTPPREIAGRELLEGFVDACFDDAAALRHVPAVIARLDRLEVPSRVAR